MLLAQQEVAKRNIYQFNCSQIMSTIELINIDLRNTDFVALNWSVGPIKYFRPRPGLPSSYEADYFLISLLGKSSVLKFRFLFWKE